MRNLADLSATWTNIALGALAIGIAGIAAMILISARTHSKRERRTHARGIYLACVALIGAWVWFYMTHLAP